LQHRHNPVRSLTLEQYQGIFSGRYMAEHPGTPKITLGDFGSPSGQHQTWKDVGGFGGIIKPFIRNIGSGSEELMQTLVMKTFLSMRISSRKDWTLWGWSLRNWKVLPLALRIRFIFMTGIWCSVLIPAQWR